MDIKQKRSIKKTEIEKYPVWVCEKKSVKRMKRNDKSIYSDFFLVFDETELNHRLYCMQNPIIFSEFPVCFNKKKPKLTYVNVDRDDFELLQNILEFCEKTCGKDIFGVTIGKDVLDTFAKEDDYSFLLAFETNAVISLAPCESKKYNCYIRMPTMFEMDKLQNDFFEPDFHEHYTRVVHFEFLRTFPRISDYKVGISDVFITILNNPVIKEGLDDISCIKEPLYRYLEITGCLRNIGLAESEPTES